MKQINPGDELFFPRTGRTVEVVSIEIELTDFGWDVMIVVTFDRIRWDLIKDALDDGRAVLLQKEKDEEN
jgi:hypothetical protein